MRFITNPSSSRRMTIGAWPTDSRSARVRSTVSAAVHGAGTGWGLATVDMTSGDFAVMQLDHGEALAAELLAQALREVSVDDRPDVRASADERSQRTALEHADLHLGLRGRGGGVVRVVEERLAILQRTGDRLADG